MTDSILELPTQRSSASEGIIAARRENASDEDYHYAHVSCDTDADVDADAQFQEADGDKGILVPLIGALPGGRELAHPLMVRIVEEDCEEGEEREFLVAEPEYHIHAVGATIPEALEAFRRIFSGYLDILSEEEEKLSSYMYGQLEYLRSAIRIL
jgi:hypothetical protein